MRRIGLLAGLVILAGCGSMLNPDGETATPSPSPLPSGVANINDTGEATLAPGRYARHDFAPRVTFEVDDQWSGRQVFDGYFTIQQGAADDPHVIAVQFAQPIGLYGADGEEEPTDAADAVAILETNADLEVVETSTSQMGGLEGSQITVENAEAEAAEFMRVPQGTIALESGRRLWIAFFDTDEGLLAVMVGGSIERWDEALATAEPVLESLEIEGG
jgi:hypothetical protein